MVSSLKLSPPPKTKNFLPKKTSLPKKNSPTPKKNSKNTSKNFRKITSEKKLQKTTSMLQGLCDVSPSAVPFVRQFYGSPFRYLWEDDSGEVHDTREKVASRAIL